MLFRGIRIIGLFMDTTRYDEKMAELRNEEVKKAGRPKGEEKVYFRKYVLKSQLASIEEWFSKVYGVTKGWADQPSEPANLPVKPPSADNGIVVNNRDVDGLKDQIKALLDDVAALTTERDELLKKRENWTRATESQKVGFWIAKHDQLKTSLMKGEFDQST